MTERDEHGRFKKAPTERDRWIEEHKDSLASMEPMFRDVALKLLIDPADLKYQCDQFNEEWASIRGGLLSIAKRRK